MANSKRGREDCTMFYRKAYAADWYPRYKESARWLCSKRLPGIRFSDDGILRHSGIAPCNMSFFSPWEVVRWSDQSLFLCFLSQGIILKLFGLISSLPVNQLVPA